MITIPQWTKRVVMEGSGRDPLGLSRVSDALTSYLLPSIITTTERARYYSFYTWVVSEISLLENETGTTGSFEEEFQRREAAFALASRLGNPNSLPIVGVQRVDQMTTPNEDGELDTDFRVLPSNSTGGFGQYYRGCLFDLNLLNWNESGDGIEPTELGQKYAAVFGRSIEGSAYIKGGWSGKARVPKQVLKDAAETFSLDAIAGDQATAEREALIRLFFNWDDKASIERPLNRQATLGLYLDVLLACETAGITVTRSEVDGGAVFWPHYFDSLADEETEAVIYTPPPVFAEVHEFWRQFSAHQFFTCALEEFLAAVLDALSPHQAGLPLEALLDGLVTNEFTADLESTLGVACPTPGALLGAIGITTIPDEQVCLRVVAKFNGANSVNECSVCEQREDTPDSRLARSMLVLALLYGKWRGRQDDRTLIRVADQAKNELWLGAVFDWLDTWLEYDLSWRDAVEHLVETISRRHDVVKYQKRKMDASWFELNNKRFVKQQDLRPGFRASRHRNATSVMQDLGLIHQVGLDEPLKVTPRGREVLEEVIRLRS